MYWLLFFNSFLFHYSLHNIQFSFNVPEWCNWQQIMCVCFFFFSRLRTHRPLSALALGGSCKIFAPSLLCKIRRSSYFATFLFSMQFWHGTFFFVYTVEKNVTLENTAEISRSLNVTKRSMFTFLIWIWLAQN